MPDSEWLAMLSFLIDVAMFIAIVQILYNVEKIRQGK